MTLSRSQRVMAGAAAVASVAAVGAAAVAFSGSASAAPGQAEQAKVSFTEGKLTYQAAPGQKNNLTVTREGKPVPEDESPYGTSTYTWLIDDSVPIAIGSDHCTYPKSGDRTAVSCTVEVEHGQDPGFISSFKLGDRDDSLKFVNVDGDGYEADRFHLGAGNDVYTSKGSADGSLVEGGKGNDTITTGKAAGDFSAVRGGAGNDTIRLGRGFVSAHGDAGNDKIFGSSTDDRLYGGAGNDVIRGDGGPDRIEGGSGNDTLYGGAGNDTLLGQAGNDKLYGGPGKDVLKGGKGKNVLKQG
ncbi:calcium-binding protein [Kineosporia babensis]|uniref:Calcium-binding protein n=1 Tax=Kineosporia babensis TaxID=499548 RepID=A0A9X1NBH4_9ACTN|nr:hypothetical protein [Kineosporia babensis]MCD5310650.1 hypothetical protein [Kineosporia babensis]